MSMRWIRTVLVIGVATAGASLLLQRPGQSALEGQDEGDEIDIEIRRSENEISVRQMSEFHVALLGRVLDRMENPENGRKEALLNVDNGAILRDHGTVWIDFAEITNGVASTTELASGDHPALLGHNVRIDGDLGQPLEWSITDYRRTPLFSFWISKRKTSVTVLECDVPSGHLFVNVGSQPSDLAGLDTKSPALGGFSQRQVLQLLQAGLSDLEKPGEE